MKNLKNCSRCSGTGKLEHFGHHNSGICFRCNGTGTDPNPSRPARKAPADVSNWVVVCDNKSVMLCGVKRTEAERVAEACNQLGNGSSYVAEAFSFNYKRGLIARNRTAQEDQAAGY